MLDRIELFLIHNKEHETESASKKKTAIRTLLLKIVFPLIMYEAAGQLCNFQRMINQEIVNSV